MCIRDRDNAVVRYCYLYNAGNSALYAKGGSRNAIFENNIIMGNQVLESDGLLGIGGWTGSSYFKDGDEYESYNMIVRNNIIFAASREAISVYDSYGARIYNNTIINPGQSAIFFRAGNGPAGETRDVEIFNNIILDTRGTMVSPIARQEAMAVYEVSHGNNLYWNAGNEIPRTAIPDWFPIVVDPLEEGCGNLVGDPMLFKMCIRDRL